MDDDDYHYDQERKAQRKRVAVGIVGVLVAIALLVLRYGNWRDRESYSAPVYVTPEVPATELAVAPVAIEYQLAVGTERLDVAPGQRLALPGGSSIVLEPNPVSLAVGDGYHFQHRSVVSIAPSADMLIASIDGVAARLQVMTAMSDAEANKLLAASIVDTGHTVGAPTPVQRTIAGKPRDGFRHDTTTGMQVEVFLVPLGKLKIGVQLYRQDPRADTAPIDELLATLAAGTGTPLPVLTTQIGAETVPLFLATPQVLALEPPVTVTVERRPMVLRTMTAVGSSLTFEHPHGVAVARMPNDQLLAVTIQSDTTALQLFDLGMRMSLEEMQRSLLGQVAAKDLGEVTRSHGDLSLRGRKLRMEMAGTLVDFELYVFTHGGKTLGAGIQYLPADEARAMALALPVLASLR